jgi:hypothetical protein
MRTASTICPLEMSVLSVGLGRRLSYHPNLQLNSSNLSIVARVQGPAELDPDTSATLSEA